MVATSLLWRHPLGNPYIKLQTRILAMKSSLTHFYARFSIQYSKVKHLWVKNSKLHSNSTSVLHGIFLRSPWLHSNLTSVLYRIFHGLIKCSVAKKKKKDQSVESRLSAGGAYFNLKVPGEKERQREKEREEGEARVSCRSAHITHLP